ncbi:MAG: hypothetical protein ACRDYV_00030 [Acidimicrobiia bacterium]
MAYELPTPVPRMDGSGFSSLPTPKGRDWKDTGTLTQERERERGRDGRPRPLTDYGLAHAVSLHDLPRLLPTPRTSDTNGDGGPDLRTAVTLLPPPKATDAKNDGPANHKRHSPGLVSVRALRPTPTAMDHKASGGSTPPDVTLTDAVVRTSLGAATNPRFDDGNTSSDGQPPPPPAPDATDSPA